ncbi:MAG TPA: DUF4350 domain-containing protein [Vicinamibacterales bacterium]
MRIHSRAAVALLLLLLRGWQASAQTGNAQQIADPNFNPTIRGRAYSETLPVVVVDEAHENFHTIGGRYKPFADVLRADGYLVAAGTQAFTKASLGSAVVLVISNAVGSGLNQSNVGNPPSAFTDAECDAVRDWVHDGGSLLLIADHAPFGATAATLAARFGVEMGKGYVWTVQGNKPEPTMTITYSRDNNVVGEHPITRGVSRVVTFTGQSLSVPTGGTALLKLNTAYESSGANAQSDVASFREGKPTSARAITNRAQAVAFEYGKGRVVMTGEAAMFSAHVIRFTDPQGRTTESKMGMNVPGNDNQQFLVNILRWLTHHAP